MEGINERRTNLKALINRMLQVGLKKKNNAHVWSKQLVLTILAAAEIRGKW